MSELQNIEKVHFFMFKEIRGEINFELRKEDYQKVSERFKKNHIELWEMKNMINEIRNSVDRLNRGFST